MLVLFETPAGYAVFKLLDENKLEEVDNLYQNFETPEAASRLLKLKHFQKFADTTEALAATTAAVEGKLCKSLKKMLKKQCSELQEQLLVADAKLGNAIKDKLNLPCVSNTAVQELMRCIRCQSDSLLVSFPKKEMTAMALGLAHSLSRYKLKFSPDKIDTMIIQAIGLLDDLDKKLNNDVMRCKEWYGWHFPELAKIITDNQTFVKVVKIIGTRENVAQSDLSDILPEEEEEKVKEAAEISMGTEISDDDIINIQHLCDQVIEFFEYRTQLYEYLKVRMMAIAPNLTVLLGEQVGARLISQAGSLINLAKQPASTVQILGAEKALFRALKTKKDTPKYGLIYHAAAMGKATTAFKGKLARMLANKSALCIRVDALGEDDGNFELGAEHKVKLESRLRLLESGNIRKLSGTARAKAKFEKFHVKSEVLEYPAAADSTLSHGVKRKFSEIEDKKPLIEELETNGTNDNNVPKKKKKKSNGVEENNEIEDVKPTIEEIETDVVENSQKKKKKKKQKTEVEDSIKVEELETDSAEKSQKKKKKKKTDDEEIKVEEVMETEATENVQKKKKKKKKTDVEENNKIENEQSLIETEVDNSQKKKKKKKKKSEDE